MHERNGRSAFVAATGILAAAVMLTACGSGDTAPPPVTVTVTPGDQSGTVGPTATKPPAGTEAPAPGGGAQPATAGNGTCVDPASPAVRSALSGLGMMGRSMYVAAKSSPEALGACPDLMWVLATIDGATASSPYRLLFFDARGFLAPASERDTIYTSVVAHGRNTVDARFRWLSDGEPSCCPQGGPVTVRFTLSGGAVTPDRPIPAEVFGS